MCEAMGQQQACSLQLHCKQSTNHTLAWVKHMSNCKVLTGAACTTQVSAQPGGSCAARPGLLLSRASHAIGCSAAAESPPPPPALLLLLLMTSAPLKGRPGGNECGWKLLHVCGQPSTKSRCRMRQIGLGG